MPGEPRAVQTSKEKKRGEGELKTLKSLTLQEPWSYRIVSKKQALALCTAVFPDKVETEPFDCLLGFSHLVMLLLQEQNWKANQTSAEASLLPPELV